ncbi:4'-phosphopantetheinyl transferase family protein [Arthrobacter rhombi]|uniref:4'-phosphopantetheinyl transferase family protein n=1 Tax=Arthrobacter rhombi TaxID=71253 RepID=UPI003FCF7A9A
MSGGRGDASAATVLHSIANVAAFAKAASQRGGLVRFVAAADLDSARRHVADRDGTRALAARALARLLGARVLGLAPITAGQLQGTVAACATCGAPHGKPGLEGLGTNWSRSGNWIMAAAALPSAGPVGVDIERIPDRLFGGFDEHCLTTAERGSLPAQDVAARLRLWVAKEALLKACGSGLSIPPAAVRTAPAPGLEPGAAPGVGPHILDDLSVQEVPAASGHAAAVAARPGLTLQPVNAAALFSGEPQHPTV